MISRTNLRQFLAVVDTGNFTRAAQRINVAQPTLSAGISELEKRLGTQLFSRSNRRVQLTEAGNKLLAHARMIEHEFRLAETSVTGAPAPIRPIKFGVLHSIATHFLEKAMARYSGIEPIEVTEGNERDLLGWLANGRIDLALTLLHSNEMRFSHHSLYSENYYMAVPGQHPLARLDSIHAKDVAGETMIARRSCEILADTSRFFTEHGVRPPFSLRSFNDDRAMAMVRAGLGITVAPETLCSEGIKALQLIGFEKSRNIGLVYAQQWQDNYRKDHALYAAFQE